MTVYFVWWVVVKLVLPDAFNPLPSRLVICGLFGCLLLASFYSSVVRNYLALLYGACACALTLHYYYLYFHNIGDPNWIVGSYITVVAVGVTLDGTALLLAYTVVVLAATLYIAWFDSVSAVALPGSITVLLLINLIGFLRGKADLERRGRISAEVDKATIEAVNRAKMLFLANMSHELRTPLTGILGYSDMLAEAPELSRDSKESLSRVRKCSKRLLEIVEQILILTQEGLSELQSQASKIDVREFIHFEVQKQNVPAAERNLSVKISFDRVDAPVFINPTHLGRIFGCVLDNAIKFTPKGSITIRVSILTEADVRTLRIIVQDTGIGIERHNWEKCFASFTQVQEDYSRKYGGAGVGLSIARKLARVMGGDVQIVDSQVGVGTTVEIHLPVRSEAS